MNLDSVTEKEISRSLHFELAEKDAALSQARFYREQLMHYLDRIFRGRDGYVTSCEARNDTDHSYTIRKGGAVLTVATSFGLDMSYKEQPPRKFYTFTARASHRNETLDTTDKANDVIEWVCRIAGGLVLGLIVSVLLILFTHHLPGSLIVLGFAGGAATGSFIGRQIGQRIYATMEKRLDAKGELTAVDEEWASLTETIDMVFDEAAKN